MAKEKITPPAGDVGKKELDPARATPETQNPPATEPSKLDDVEAARLDAEKTAAETERVKAEEAEAEAARLEAEKAKTEVGKKNSKPDYPSFLAQYVKLYPKNKEFHVTTDHMVFLSPDKNMALNHQNSLGDGGVVETYKI